MNKLLTILLLFFGLLVLSSPALAETYDLYLLAGQSNMDGRGLSSDLSAEQLEQPKNVSIFYRNPPHSSDGWKPLGSGFSIPPKYKGKIPSNKFGPELGFAKAMSAKHPDRKIALIKGSKGGSSLRVDWNPGTTGKPETQGERYRFFLETIQTATTELTTKGHSIRIRGLLWHQGESDSKLKQANYQKRLIKFIARIREDVGVKDLPVIVGEVADNGKRDNVRAALKTVGTSGGRLGFVSSVGLTTWDEGTHFDAASQLTMGKRYAEEMLRIESGTKPKVNPAKEVAANNGTNDKPNILFIFSDDHALNSISAYGGPLAKAAPTPNIDRIAREGALFRNSFCANSICGPSRACILTGKHSHINGFMRNSRKAFDQTQWTFPKTLQSVGYQTAVIGKWHLKSDPVAFDHWEVFPGQGSYYNPEFIQMDGSKKKFEGYATDLTTDKAVAWLESRDKNKPFMLMCQHKAPHRTFAPALRHLGALDDVEIPEPKTLFDDYANRSKTLATNEMEIDRHMTWAYDLKIRKTEQEGLELPKFRSYGTPEYNRMTEEQRKEWDEHFSPKNRAFVKDYKAGKINAKQLVQWKYQRYIRNYLETVKAVDDSVGRLLKYLDDNDLADNTVVIYSSDQGFYLGEHGWFDKRWMFEESFKMPFAIRWPGKIKPGSKPEALIQNIDYAPTFLEIAGQAVPEEVQGKSLVPIFLDSTKKVRDSLYYGYYELGEHAVPQHFGVRTQTHKLFYLPQTNEWQMFDLVADPNEMLNIYGQTKHAEIQAQLKAEYHRLRKEFDAPDYEVNP